MDNGFIKLHRSLLDWEWYSDVNTKAVFIHLLLNANWEESKFRGYDVPKGGLVTGVNSLSESLGISVRSVRTALEHLKSTNEVTIKSTNKFSIVTIVNWEKYQCRDEQPTSKMTTNLTNNRQTTDKQLTTEEEYKNIKNIRNIFTPPTLEEVTAYCKERNNDVNPQRFIDFYESKGWTIGKNKMKDWRACVRTWERNRDNNKTEKKNQFNNFQQSNYDWDEINRELGIQS